MEEIEITNESNFKGYGIFRLFLCLLIQFMEDISDRELEESLKTNLTSKWFCQYGLKDSTPNYSLFSKVRSRIGTKRLATIFNSSEIN